jgi:hypothetical protein
MTEEDMQKMKQYFADKLTNLIEQRAIFREKFQQTNQNALTPFKSYSAFAFVVSDELADIFELLKNIYESLIEIDKDVSNRTQKLEQIVQDVSNQVGGMTNVKAELDDLKRTIKEPMFARLDQFIQTMKENAEKRRNAGDPYVE